MLDLSSSKPFLGMGLLGLASEGHNNQKVEMLLDYGLDVNEHAAWDNFTPLRCATRMGQSHNVESLLNRGALQILPEVRTA